MQHLQDGLYPCLTERRETPQIGPSDRDRVSPQSKRLEDVSTSSETRISNRSTASKSHSVSDQVSSKYARSAARVHPRVASGGLGEGALSTRAR